MPGTDIHDMGILQGPRRGEHTYMVIGILPSPMCIQKLWRPKCHTCNIVLDTSFDVKAA